MRTIEHQADKNADKSSSPCDICGTVETQLLFETHDRLDTPARSFEIRKCHGCGVLRTFPEMSDAELAEFYPDHYWGEEPTQDWIIKSQSEKTAFLARYASDGRILDVGCGSGYFLRALDEDKWDRYGVETGPEAVAAARKYLGEQNVAEGSLMDSRFEAESFDVITFWSALEHMNEPTGALNVAHRILKTEGKLIVQVPNSDSYQARVFKGRWFALDAPRHRYHFSETVLRRFLNDNGFEIERITFSSNEHNAHALRQSLKSKLTMPFFGRAAYLLIKPFSTPFDNFLSGRGHGATITLLAGKM